MRSSIKIDETKLKNQDTLREIHRVAQANSLRLQQMEVAVANLTSICSALRTDMSSLLSVSAQDSIRKVNTEANEVKPLSARSSSTGVGLKDQMLGLQMQQLVEQAAALGIFKEPATRSTNVSGQVKTSRAPTQDATKTVHESTAQKSSTKPLIIKTKESTTQKKMHIKLGATKSMVTTQPKGKLSPQSDVKPQKAATTAKVTLKSTVKKTQTTISEVSRTNKHKANPSRPNISVKSSIQNVRTIKRQGSIKLKIQVGKGDKLPTTTKTHVSAKTGSPSSATAISKADLKPRRRWSTTKDITLIK